MNYLPYAFKYLVFTTSNEFVAYVVKCPVCGVYIEEKAMKDEESHTDEEYQKHYEELHA